MASDEELRAYLEQIRAGGMQTDDGNAVDVDFGDAAESAKGAKDAEGATGAAAALSAPSAPRHAAHARKPAEPRRKRVAAPRGHGREGGERTARVTAGTRILASMLAAVLLFVVAAAGMSRANGGYGFPHDMDETLATITVPRLRTDSASLAGAISGTDAIDDYEAVKAGAVAAADAYAANPAVGTSYSLVVMDMDGQILADHEGSVAREPASTTKTLTAFAAATTLDLQRTLDTQVFVSQEGSSVVLTLKGNGDVLLGRGENDEGHINGRAGLATLTARTVAALDEWETRSGVHAGSVELRYDDTMFGDKRFPDGIEQSNDYYVNEMPGASMAIDLDRQWGGYHDPDPDKVATYPSKTDTPALNVAREFASQLDAAGVAVGDLDAPVSATLPEDAELLASVSSAPLYDLLRLTLKNSSNTLAEEFGRLVALATGHENSPEGAAAAVTQAVQDAGISSEGLHLADCSGLTIGTRISAVTLADVQRHLVMGDGNPAFALEGELVPGIDKLRGAYTPDSYGLAHTKSGTLGFVRSLAGMATLSDGGAVFFAAVCTNMPSWWGAGNANEQFASALAVL